MCFNPSYYRWTLGELLSVEPRCPEHRFEDFKIPRFPQQEIIDVEYVDVSNSPIIDPSFLLAQFSITPYSIEERRRHKQHNDIFRLIDQIEGLLRIFERKSLHFARGINKCPYRWESELSEKVLDAYYLMEEQVLSALSEFRRTALQPSWYLWECLGCNDEEYTESVREDEESTRRFILHSDFVAAVNSLFGYEDNFLDNLPF